MFNFYKNKILIFSIFSLLFLFSSNNVLAENNYFYESIKVDIQINKDSTFDVIENQTYSLDGNFGYFYRDIKIKGLDHISNIEVFDNGRKLEKGEYKVSNKGSYVSIRWDFNRRDFNNELKSWTIKYKVHGGLGFYESYDEIYWNAIFADDRAVPVKYGEAIVHLPKEFSESEIGKRMFIGQLNSNVESHNYEVIDSKTVKYWGNNIGPSEFLTVVATWPKGAVIKPFLYRNQIINWIILLMALIIPIAIFFKAYSDWKKDGKDAKINKTIIAQYEPFNKLSPALMGVLMTQNVDMKQILATVVDLAVRGYIRIREEENKVLFFKSKQYVFEKLKPENDLKHFEQKIMKGIFSNKDSVSSDDLKNKFYKHISEIKKDILEEIEKNNYFKNNIEKTRNKYTLKYLLIFPLIFIVVFAFAFLSSSFSTGLGSVYIALFVVSMIASIVIGMLFAYYMPALTDRGAEAKWHSLGFKQYLHTAERFRIGAETLDTFSKFLPYAMIFGVEKQWAQRFSDFSFEEQRWFVPIAHYGGTGQGAGMSSISDFSSNFSTFASSISGTLGSSPGGSSGMGGGGGAGGGGGGGGGGAG